MRCVVGDKASHRECYFYGLLFYGGFVRVANKLMQKHVKKALCVTFSVDDRMIHYINSELCRYSMYE